MFIAKVFVTLKKEVLDPQGDTVRKGLHTMGYRQVEDVRVGKYVEVKLTAASMEAANQQVNEMCDKLLANPVIEEYRIELAEV